MRRDMRRQEKSRFPKHSRNTRKLFARSSNFPTSPVQLGGKNVRDKSEKQQDPPKTLLFGVYEEVRVGQIFKTPKKHA